jgi:VanZ family protein
VINVDTKFEHKNPTGPVGTTSGFSFGFISVPNPKRLGNRKGVFDIGEISISDCRAARIPLSFRVARFRILLKYWLPPLAWMILIFSASGDAKSYQHSSTLFEPLLHWLFPQMPQMRVELIHHIFRKIGHLTEYALLALLLWRAIRQPQKTDRGARRWRWDEAGLSLALVFLYAASDEFHQIFIATRTALVSDIFIDTSGGAIGLLLLWVIGKSRKHW